MSKDIEAIAKEVEQLISEGWSFYLAIRKAGVTCPHSKRGHKILNHPLILPFKNKNRETKKREQKGLSFFRHGPKREDLFVLFILMFSVVSNAIENGDILFIKSQTSQSQALRDATGSEWTHTAIYYNNRVVESTGSTSLNSFINRSKNKEIRVRRLPSFEDTKLFRDNLKRYSNTPYDIYFEWSDVKIYCSEFVYKVFYKSFGVETGALQKFSDMNLTSSSVQALIKQRYRNGKKFDEFETIVTPVSILDSNSLIDVPL